MMRSSSSSSNFPLIISFQILIIFISLCAFTITPSSGDFIKDLACNVTNCGEGKCVASNATLLGFDCDCNSGWKKIQIGPLTFPSCVIPNCTLNFQCGNGAPPLPPPPLPILPPNISDPCNLIWCGEGTCLANGTEHVCKCYDGSANLFDNSSLACIKQCSLGADCKGLRFGPPSPPPPSPSSASPGVGLGFGPPPPPPPSPSSGPPNMGSKGSNEAPNCLRNFYLLMTVVFSATFLAWF